MSVKVMVPARLTPLVDVTLVNLTPTVQVPPGAKTVPVHVSAPATALKNQVRTVPPETATPVTVTGEVVEVLVRVTVPVPIRGLAVPVANVIVKGLGVIETVPGGTPVPLRAIGEPLMATLPPTVSVAFTNPLAVGENTTLMVQVAPAARFGPHVPPAVPGGRE